MSSEKVKFTRKWAMPNKNTFDIKPINDFVLRNTREKKIIVDPFARDSKIATITNDLNPNTGAQYHMQATAFLRMLANKNVIADAVLLDPPYSPRQISECYQVAGLKVDMTTTQNAKMWKICRRYIYAITGKNSVVLSFGWNSAGMGKGWIKKEIMLVCHGGGHNDTICVLEEKEEDLFY